MANLPRVLMIGTGEYTTGFVHGSASTSDKPAGVVGLTCFDLRRRGKLSELFMVGTDGTKYPAIRKHLKEKVSDVYNGMDVSFHSFPGDNEKDPNAYIKAMDQLEKGDLVIIFTPDDTHFPMTMEAIKRGLHVLVTKPAVKTLQHHREIVAAAKEHNVLVMIEVHKRYDPVFSDARHRAISYGPFSHFNAFMSQPKKQLDTFSAWAGLSSDISYYLNSHFVDLHVWYMGGRARPVRVNAVGAKGVASAKLGRDMEDVITIVAVWENMEDKSIGTAVYTSSWTASQADVHSQQRYSFHAHRGEISVDQAHRGYTVQTDKDGFASVNPLFFRYTPDALGNFGGQECYGYKSFEVFVDAATNIKKGTSKPEDFDAYLPTMRATTQVTAILHSGRLSLDNGGAFINIQYGDDLNPLDPTDLVIEQH